MDERIAKERSALRKKTIAQWVDTMHREQLEIRQLYNWLHAREHVPLEAMTSADRKLYLLERDSYDKRVRDFHATLDWVNRMLQSLNIQVLER